MNSETIKNLVKDWRVALLLVLVVGSLIGIYLAPRTRRRGLRGTSSSVSISKGDRGCRWSSSPWS